MSIIRRTLGKVDPTIEFILDVLILFHALIFVLMIVFCVYDSIRDKRTFFRSQYIAIAQQLEKDKKMKSLQVLKKWDEEI